MNETEIKLRVEIQNLKRMHVELIKKNLALKMERDEYRRKFESLSVHRLKTVRIKVNGDSHE